VACPYFEPVQPLESSAWARPPRYPLGDAYTGVCRARPDAAFEPPKERQEAVCNFGYAHGQCDCFPSGGSPDAVRFSILADEGERITVLYVLEKDYAPVEHGAPSQGLVAIQARAFLSSYLRRRSP
jgi:hypothetical protein